MRRHRFLHGGAAALAFLATLSVTGCQNNPTPIVAHSVAVPTIAAQATALVNAPSAEQAQSEPSQAQATPDSDSLDASGGAVCVTSDGAPFVAASC